MFEDWLEINRLLMIYAEQIDEGQFAEAAQLFAAATYRIEHANGEAISTYRGADAVREFFAGTRVHADGTPRTKHVITNVAIDVGGDTARARCYATVFQQTETLPLQPIASGRYLDRFERVGGRWRYADRLITGFLLGDRSEHVVWHEGTPGEGSA